MVGEEYKMIEQLIKVVEMHGTHAVVIEIEGRGRYYNIKKAAGKFGVTRWTISHWLEKGGFKDTFTYPSGRMYISAREIEEMLNPTTTLSATDYKT